MDRRHFLASLAALPALSFYEPAYAAPASRYDRLLILIELKGGNDGLNTLIPYADVEYKRLRPRLAIPREHVVNLTEGIGLHPALANLKPLWDAGELAWVQGLGYPEPNLSHFRSIEIWDSASGSQEYLSDGWLARLFKQSPPPACFAAEGVSVASDDMGPLAGARAVSLSDPAQFISRASLVHESAVPANGALAHILKVGGDIRTAAEGLNSRTEFKVEFPRHRFGQACQAAARVAAGRNVAVLRISHGGFDTHANQLNSHERLLRELSEGLTALRTALVEQGLWDRSLIMSYAEFGRRPQENGNGGSDHGTSAPHFVLGGSIKGGLYGQAPSLARLEGGNLVHTVDFRSLYATVIERWWGADPQRVLGGRFKPLDFVSA
jgi:uncharacterized protein (DUF1501 family)